MNARFIRLIFSALAAVFFLGCGSKENARREEATEKIELFKEGKGIRLDDDMKQLFGVEVAEVSEKSFARTLTNSAAVYQISDGVARATMQVDEAVTHFIKPRHPVFVMSAHNSIGGTVAGIERGIAATAGALEAMVEFPHSDKALSVGSFVSVVIHGEPKSVTVVPRDAVLSAADGDYVYTVNGRHLTRSKVITGTAFDGFVEIADGLYAGDSVAVKGVSGLWFVELGALKGGTPCCVKPKK